MRAGAPHAQCFTAAAAERAGCDARCVLGSHPQCQVALGRVCCPRRRTPQPRTRATCTTHPAEYADAAPGRSSGRDAICRHPESRRGTDRPLTRARRPDPDVVASSIVTRASRWVARRVQVGGGQRSADEATREAFRSEAMRRSRLLEKPPLYAATSGGTRLSLPHIVLAEIGLMLQSRARACEHLAPFGSLRWRAASKTGWSTLPADPGRKPASDKESPPRVLRDLAASRGRSSCRLQRACIPRVDCRSSAPSAAQAATPRSEHVVRISLSIAA